MEKQSPYRMRRLTWVLLSFLLVLLLSLVIPYIDFSDVERRILEMGTVVSALIMLIIGMFLIRRLNQRLAALAEVAEMVGRGNYLVRSRDDSSDAVGVLSQAVNAMVDKIQHSVEALENNHAELEENRRTLEEQHSQLSAEYERQAVFGEFLGQLNTVDINTIAENGLHYLMTLSSALLGQFYLTQDDDELKLLIERGIDREALAAMGDGSGGVLAEALRRGEWVIVEKLSGANLPKINLGFTQVDLLTLVAAPLVFQGKSLGVVLFGFMEELDATQRLQVQSVLDAVAGSLNNALTYKMVQKQALKLEQANQELLESDRLRSEFVANMSHELRTPLNSVIGFSAVMSKNRDGNLRDKDLDYIEKINRNGKHLLGLINDILDLSKIEAGRMDVEMRWTSLPDVVTETCEMLKSQAEVKHIFLNCQTPEAMPRVETDAGKLKQVLINLIGNAIKFTEQGGVSVELTLADNRFYIRIKDTGIGVAADKQKTIFEPFRQADAGTTRQYGGTGLGLAITQSMVELLGGSIRLHSELHQGSEFIVELPYVVEAQVPDKAASPDVNPVPGVNVDELKALQGKTLLIVDDDPDARDLLCSYVSGQGVKVIQAASGEEALALARQHQPDIITLDIMMPGMDGWATLQALKGDAAVAGIPVVVLSIVAEKNKATVLGAVDALNKPVVQQELLQTLQRSLGKAHSQCILVVDDDPDIWELYKHALQEHVGQLIFAENGRVALEKLEAHRVDMIFLDLMMPEMDGLTLLRILRADKHWFDLPVAVVTAKQLSAAERRELESRVVDVVEKGEQMVEEQLLNVFKKAVES